MYKDYYYIDVCEILRYPSEKKYYSQPGQTKPGEVGEILVLHVYWLKSPFHEIKVALFLFASPFLQIIFVLW